ncbi:MAG: hypothetical protein ACRDJO_00570 [Actinomycetota bacterium]
MDRFEDEPLLPIYVLGGTRYLHVAATVAEALDHAVAHAARDSFAGIGQLDFYDATGQPLRPAGPPEQPDALVPSSAHGALEYRVRRLLENHRGALELALANGDAPEGKEAVIRGILDGSLDFDSLGRTLAGLPPPAEPAHFLPGMPHSNDPWHNMCHFLHLCR